VRKRAASSGDTADIPRAGLGYWFGARLRGSRCWKSGSGGGWLTSFDAEMESVRWKYQAPHPLLVRRDSNCRRWVFAADMGGIPLASMLHPGACFATSSGQSDRRRIVTYVAVAGDKIGRRYAWGMKSPGVARAVEQSRILVCDCADHARRGRPHDTVQSTTPARATTTRECNQDGSS